jgi:hypothetical protein
VQGCGVRVPFVTSECLDTRRVQPHERTCAQPGVRLDGAGRRREGTEGEGGQLRIMVRERDEREGRDSRR